MACSDCYFAKVCNRKEDVQKGMGLIKTMPNDRDEKRRQRMADAVGSIVTQFCPVYRECTDKARSPRPMTDSEPCFQADHLKRLY